VNTGEKAVSIILSIALALQPAAAEIEPDGRGSVLLYRSEAIMGFGLGCPVRFEGKEITDLAPGEYIEWRAPPGRYVLLNKTASIEVTVEAGKTKYVRCVIKTGFLTGRSDLQPSDRSGFEKHRADYDNLGVRVADIELAPEPKSLADELAKLAELKAAGALTDAEFDAAKAKLLAGAE
jgi:hypothetical protein